MTSIEQQVILVTGATDGLGREVATSLARQGATVLLHGRNQEKGATLADDLRRSTGNSKIRYYNADLSSLSEVRQLAATIRAAEPRLTVLANNAGIGPVAPQAPRQTSADGHELFFAVNYLAGYLLTHALLPLLRA
jgi:NAD(P)-dependent dehydrogenase (short-subunit alcohol dehydrogenase family)